MEASALPWYCLFYLLIGPSGAWANPVDGGQLTIVANQEKLQTIKENNTMNIILNSTALLNALGCNCERKCESGRKRFQIIISHQLSWHDAVIYCKERWMDLATIRSQEEHNRMLADIKKAGLTNGEKTQAFWIGGTKLHSSRGFFWMSDGEELFYTNWIIGQPDDYDQAQKCMAYQHGWGGDIRWAWDDNFCTSALPFACEYC